MPQFRLTQKFSTDCKIKKLLMPAVTSHPLDDWFIDRIIVDRKKIAMIVHAKTIFCFLIPYAEVGGAKNIPEYFKARLKELFQRDALPELVLEVDKLFSESTSFTKTVDKKVLGHMNDFKFHAEPYADEPLPVNWYDTAERINNMPTKGGSKDWMFPVERFNQLLGINLSKK